MTATTYDKTYDMTRVVPDRTTVRHSWALAIEGVDHDSDQTKHPYTNWGYANRLDYLLRKVVA